MREIKFRAWDEDDNCYWYWQIGDIVCAKSSGAIWDGLPQPVAFPIQQYTGLKDKNCKEIYEGDVLVIQDKNSVNGDVENETSHVRWQKDIAGFIISNYSGEGFGSYKTEDLEVIGNIHQNPELLT